MIPSNCRIPPGVRVRLRKIARCIAGFFDRPSYLLFARPV